MAHTLLVVDDDPDFRHLLSMRLSVRYAVLEAASGEEALTLLKNPNEIDIVILDEIMPGMRGVETLKKIKQISPEVKTILLTGHGSKEIVMNALRARADEFIEKPLGLENLQQTIDTLLRVKEGLHNLDACDAHGKIEKVKHFVERNFDRKVSLKDAAKAVCLSPKYLSRLFKQEMGDGFSHFRSGLRITKAKEWLETTGYGVSQISDKLGYQNVESFIRAFRKTAGCTPSAYRHKSRPPKKAPEKLAENRQ